MKKSFFSFMVIVMLFFSVNTFATDKNYPKEIELFLGQPKYLLENVSFTGKAIIASKLTERKDEHIIVTRLFVQRNFAFSYPIYMLDGDSFIVLHLDKKKYWIKLTKHNKTSAKFVIWIEE